MPSSDMNSLDSILAAMQTRDDCLFEPPSGFPVVPEGLHLPADLAHFYGRFGEARLFGDRSDPHCHILPPAEFVQIGLALGGREITHGLQRHWHALAHVQDGNYFAIDLAPGRLGWCYDVFHETYRKPDYCKILALSFTELLEQVARGEDRAWWLAESFKGYGYADQPVRDGR